MTYLKVSKLCEDAILPTKSPTEVGRDVGILYALDLYSLTSFTISPHSSLVVRTGLSIKIDPDCGYIGLILPRQSLLVNHNVGVVSYYLGDDDVETDEVMITLTNDSDGVFMSSAGSKIAMLAITIVLSRVKV